MASRQEILQQLREQAELQAKISNSLEGYIDGLKKAKAVEEEIKRLKKIELDVQNKLNNARASGDALEIAKQTKILDILQEQTTELSEQNNQLKTALKDVNKKNLLISKSGAALTKGLINTFASLPSVIDKTYGKLRGYGLFDMAKAMKQTSLSMGIMGTQSQSLEFNIDKAANSTLSMGVGIEELSKYQAEYSEELGRSVMLGQKGLKSIAAMAKGTSLGSEGAAKMAADFEKQGFSAERTKNFIEEAVNSASKLGLNASKVIKNIQQNFSLINKYNFKGGIKGLVKMAETTTKLGVDMNFVSGMAEKLFDVEGAVDMSAQLQVMGGAWAKLADPFHLMYMARNDMEGLADELGKAAEASVHFNKENKSFEISSLEMHRLRKIAEQTGVSYEDLATAGKKAAAFSKINKQLTFSLGGGKEGKELKEFLQNNSGFNENGEAYIELNSEPKLLKTLSYADKTLLQQQINQKKDLETRAKDARTFDDALNNTLNLFKKSLLPIVKSFEPMIEKFDGLVDRFINSGWMGKIEKFSSQIGGLIASIGGWILDNPIKSAFIYGVTVFSGMLLNKANWIMNGIALSEGFKLGSSGGSLLDMGKSVGLSFAKIAGPALVGVLASWLGGSMYDKVVGEKKKTDNWSDNWGKKLGRLAITTGTGAAAGAGIGAIGGLGIGAVPGAIAGGVGGLGKGLYDEFISEPVKDGLFTGSNKSERGVLQGGKITPIDKKDDLLAMKKGGTIDKVVNSSTNVNKVMKHEFSDLNINGEIKINLPGNVSISTDMLKSPEFIRNLSQLIQADILRGINQVQKG